MHAFNTFDLESFQYPNACARCAENEPSVPWELIFKELNFPDGIPTGLYNERREYNTYKTRVPICADCQRELKRQARVCWMLAAVAGAVVICYLLPYTLATGMNTRACYSTSIASGLFIGLVAGWLMKKTVIDGCGFAKYNGQKRTIRFKNKQFQELFDRLNFQSQGPTSWRSQVAGR